jgi:hypothetical protein
MALQFSRRKRDHKRDNLERAFGMAEIRLDSYSTREKRLFATCVLANGFLTQFNFLAIKLFYQLNNCKCFQRIKLMCEFFLSVRVVDELFEFQEYFDRAVGDWKRIACRFRVVRLLEVFVRNQLNVQVPHTAMLQPDIKCRRNFE